MKYQMINKLLILIISFGWLYYTCDAPRQNPLDPENPDNNLTTLSGQVETLSHLPVSTANVYWQNDNRYLKTDEQGSFTIENIQPEDGWIHFSKTGFWNDSVYIEWDKDSGRKLNIALNAKPRLDSLLIYSIIKNIQSNPQNLTIDVETIIYDPDNDIDTVYLENPGLNFRNYLPFDYTIQMHRRIFSTDQLGISISNIDAVIANEFYIVVKDKFGHRISLDKISLKRIIQEPITIEEDTTRTPLNYEIVSSTPTLSWYAIYPGYSLDYNVEIYLGKDVDNIIWQKKGVLQYREPREPNQKISINVEGLSAGQNYSWTIWYTDAFQNRSRSWIKNFIVE